MASPRVDRHGIPITAEIVTRHQARDAAQIGSGVLDTLEMRRLIITPLRERGGSSEGVSARASKRLPAARSGPPDPWRTGMRAGTSVTMACLPNLRRTSESWRVSPRNGRSKRRVSGDVPSLPDDRSGCHMCSQKPRQSAVSMMLEGDGFLAEEFMAGNGKSRARSVRASLSLEIATGLRSGQLGRIVC
jgi:hypothetical protein